MIAKLSSCGRPRFHGLAPGSAPAVRRSRPFGLITQLAWIFEQMHATWIKEVDHCGNQGRAARAWGVEEACPEVEPFALARSFHRVVDGLTADLKRVGDLLGGESFGEGKQEHRLSPTRSLAKGVWSTRSSSSPYKSSLKIIGAIAPPP